MVGLGGLGMGAGVGDVGVGISDGLGDGITGVAPAIEGNHQASAPLEGEHGMGKPKRASSKTSSNSSRSGGSESGDQDQNGSRSNSQSSSPVDANSSSNSDSGAGGGGRDHRIDREPVAPLYDLDKENGWEPVTELQLGEFVLCCKDHGALEQLTARIELSKERRRLDQKVKEKVEYGLQ